jgi:broad-specificity NMP kinase
MPPLTDGCYVVAKYVEYLKDIRDGTTYVLITRDEGIVYKRVYKKGYGLSLHSDNLKYQAYDVKASDILEIWEFVCTLNISDQKPEDPNMDNILYMLQSMKKDIEKLK